MAAGRGIWRKTQGGRGREQETPDSVSNSEKRYFVKSLTFRIFFCGQMGYNSIGKRIYFTFLNEAAECKPQPVRSGGGFARKRVLLHLGPLMRRNRRKHVSISKRNARQGESRPLCCRPVQHQQSGVDESHPSDGSGAEFSRHPRRFRGRRTVYGRL